jgi:hypothetical protein
LIHRLRGWPSNWRLEGELRQLVLSEYRRLYQGFGARCDQPKGRKSPPPGGSVGGGDLCRTGEGFRAETFYPTWRRSSQSGFVTFLAEK